MFSDADLAVRDDAAAVLVHVFYRVLDGDNVAACLLVTIAHHRSQRRGLARAGRANHDAEAALGHHDVLQDRRQLELFDGRNRRVDLADHATRHALLHKRAHAEAADAGRGDREVCLLAGVELARLAIVHDRADEHRALLGSERLVGLRPDFAVDLDRRRKSRGGEQARRDPVRLSLRHRRLP